MSKPSLPKIDPQYLMDFLVELLNTPCPIGFTDKGIEVIEKWLSEFSQLTLERTKKGALLITWPGESQESSRCVSAHIDTLGGIVKEVKENGRLEITSLGGLIWNSVECEGVTVFTSDEHSYRGAFMVNYSSAHVHGGNKIRAIERTDENMEIRLNERVLTSADTRALGIEVGDFVAFDPRVEIQNNFICGRFLDDKIGIAIMVAAMKSFHDAGIKPKYKTYYFISNAEEFVVHGTASDIPEEIDEFLSVDIAAIGTGQNSDEFHASIAMKDAGGPYHRGFSNKLRKLAKQYNLDVRPDVFTY
ncbi:MAG: peptidase M42, partial [Anaerolineaceae bacterium]|nr:peptidase M42 [Anaerolineaceae bacterium]